MSIDFRISRDPRLLDQYYALREQCFRKELGLVDFDRSEEEQDRRGQILLTIEDGRCIGGARISPNVALQSQVQQLELRPGTCCMWERFVIDPAVRTVELIREYIANLIKLSQEAGYDNAMILSSLRNARFYRRCHSALGVAFHIQRPVPHSAGGAFAGLEHYLSVAYLQDVKPLKVASSFPRSHFRNPDQIFEQRVNA